ncbi:MAG: hypothetical protein H6742_18320 [Alphaproteobacteria bacterium]|nr:hypothetical protein [Alphaproteobacteria bacterium]
MKRSVSFGRERRVAGRISCSAPAGLGWIALLDRPCSFLRPRGFWFVVLGFPLVRDVDIFNSVTSSSWLQRLRDVPLDFRVVQHDPMTRRYDRANQKLDYLVREGRFLGIRASERTGAVAIELAVWTRSAAGKGCGYYACFRLFLDDHGTANYAVLFCFYDGTDGSPCLKGFESALTFARSNGFKDNDHA